MTANVQTLRRQKKQKKKETNCTFESLIKCNLFRQSPSSKIITGRCLLQLHAISVLSEVKQTCP